jgi:hypothetical protein
MTRGIAATTICLLLVTADESNSESRAWSANAVMPGCRSLISETGPINYETGKCGGVVAGLIDMGGLSAFCPPSGVTYEQAARVIVRFIDANPARMNERFTRLAVEALAKAWPCKPAPGVPR